MRAAVTNQLPALRTLLAAGAAVDATDARGNSALHMAVEARAHGTVEALLEAGADRTLRNREGRTPLELAGGGS